tara:strand:- start:4797 stop:5456 length:660 start_codon:yes stop_codon:yes gene_type:complete
MKKILCFGYRDWAIEIYNRLADCSRLDVHIFTEKELLTVDLVIRHSPDFILFYGWSWYVPSEIVSGYSCLMLHPSALPSFRGGSPLQNQIIRGVTSTKSTIFLMDHGLDTGDILRQAELSLEGNIPDIFSRLSTSGFDMTVDIINNGFNAIPQSNVDCSVFKRRTPSDSEITQSELQHQSAKYLYNKVRMLTGPYPRAYIRTSDGKKLLLHSVEIVDDL